MSIEDMIETLADGVCKIADVLCYRFDNLSYDEHCILNNVYCDVHYIKDELLKLKGGE